MKRPVGSGIKHIRAAPCCRFTDDERATIERMVGDCETLTGIARALGRSFSSVENYMNRRRTLRRADAAIPATAAITVPLAVTVTPTCSERTFEVARDGTATTTTLAFEPVRTLEQLVIVCEIDLEQWRVVSWEARAWGMGAKSAEGVLTPTTMYRVRAVLEPRGVDPRQLAAGLIDGLRVHVRPLRALTRSPNDSGYLFVATFGEPHLGKMAWAPETGESYDLKIACDRVRTSHRHLMQRAQALQPEKIALILGDDYFTADNTANTTTAGTPQEIDGRYRKVFRAGITLAREIIEGWRRIAPVEVWVKVGNHDETQSWHAGEVLAAVYAGAPDVTVINPDRLRHYQQWGTCLIGLTHGNKENDAKLPMLMASESGAMWSNTTCRVWLCAHLHTRGAKSSRLVARPIGADVEEVMGVMIRRCASLSGTDAWHFGMGYVGNIKASEGFVFHKVLGETDIHTGVVHVDAA